MSNEIKITTKISVTHGNFVIPQTGSNQLNIDQSVPGGGLPGYLVLTTTPVAIDLTDLTAEGFCFIKNCDEINNVFFGSDDGGYRSFGKLKPNEEALFRLEPGVALAAKCDGSGDTTCIIQVFED